MLLSSSRDPYRINTLRTVNRHTRRRFSSQPQAWRARCDEVQEREEFEAEGRVAEKAKERHLEDVQELDPGGVVGPLRVGVEVPELPEEPAHESTERQRHDGPQVSTCEVPEKRGTPAPRVDGLREEEGRSPE